ncbi:hypothetical protein KR222_009045 [Zaprionus bogoriensis]|nr:hypothetical protein KR222_009045 [Zaprionus bogoriensis]
MSTDTGMGMHINETSQLEYNRITPLPAATSNAPFEQTFRITVLLPKDQLYVTRLGARVPLSKLLSLVCDNKQLDADKYEFRNPVDASQVFSCESTIGAVGLSEIRLCHKSESYDSFNADTMLKFQRTAATRDSLSSSSDFSSSRHSHSKLTAKTPSPYSSSNSLNSMDSTGMNYTRTPVVPPKALAPPPRKKRAAPRPPSQLVIPEQSVAQFNTVAGTAAAAAPTPTPPAPAPAGGSTPTEPAYAVIVKRPQLCMSTPNLASTPERERELERELELDCNGNSAKTPDADGHYATLDTLKTNGTAEESAGESVGLPEPTPRKRLLQLKKKTAPAPPPAADSISLASTTASITEVLLPPTPQPAPRITTPSPATVLVPAAAAVPVVEALPVTAPERVEAAAPTVDTVLAVSAAPTVPVAVPATGTASAPSPTPSPAPVPAATLVLAAVPAPSASSPAADESTLSSSTSLQARSLLQSQSQLPTQSVAPPKSPSPSPSQSPSQSPLTNVSKVLLNRTPTPEPRSLGSTTEDEGEEEVEADNHVDNDAASKQADSGIGEPVPSPSPEPETDKSQLESSSEDDEAVKVYNFKTSCQTSLKTQDETLSLSLAELSKLSEQQDQQAQQQQLREQEPLELTSTVATPSTASELTSLSSWNYAVPISPPPDFSDSQRVPGSPLDGIVGELSAIIQEQRLDTLIRQAPPEQTPIEAAKPNRLTNFSIASIGQGTGASAAVTNGNDNGNASTSNGNSSATTPTSITRADSFQAVGQSPRHSHNGFPSSTGLGPRLRSSSQLSLNKLELNGNGIGNGIGGLQQRRSSSELSIAESPSLQSLELIKSILSNSRKNSLVDTTDAVTPATDTPTVVPVAPASPTSSPAASPAAATPSPSPSLSSSPAPASASAASTTPSPTPAKAEQPLPPTYRYSGPPSINFATWSERPKSQVIIKNEGDYIFGGAKTSPATPPSKPAKLSIEVASPILRMGIPRKEYHVPITVRPLRDVSEEQQAKEQLQQEQVQPKAQQRDQLWVKQQREESSEQTREQPREQSREQPKEQPREQPRVQPREQPWVREQREYSKEQLREQSEQVQPTLRELVKPSTLPRPAKSNRYTLPAGVVSSVQLNHNNSTSKNSASNVSNTNSLPRPLSTATPAATSAEPSAAPFGQNTLRRTGFKERMLAKEQQEKEQALRVRVSTGTAAATAAPTAAPTTATAATVASATATVAATSPPAPAAKPKMVIRSGKLELKLQQPAESVMLQVKLRPTKTTTATATTTVTSAPAAASPTAKAAPAATAAAATPAAPPPPPALPKLSTSTRKVGAVTPTSAPDPRMQLLEAIRNFKREELNRA